MKLLGSKLRALCESIGMSQIKMAEALGSTQSGIHRYENGQSALPICLVWRYAVYFDVSMDYVYGQRT